MSYIDLGETSRIFCYNPDCDASINGKFVVKVFSNDVTGRVGLFASNGWNIVSMRDEYGRLMLVFVCPDCKTYHRIYGGQLWESVTKERGNNDR